MIISLLIHETFSNKTIIKRSEIWILLGFILLYWLAYEHFLIYQTFLNNFFSYLFIYYIYYFIIIKVHTFVSLRQYLKFTDDISKVQW